MKQDPKPPRDILIRFVCENGTNEGLSFSDILLLFGENAGLEVIEKYSCPQSRSTRQRRLREYRSQLQCFQSESLQRKRRYGFEPWSGFFFLRDAWLNGKDNALVTKSLFSTMEDMKKYAESDLGDPDPFYPPDGSHRASAIDKYAPSPVDFNHCPKEYSKHKVTKKYVPDDGFIVSQEWFDSEGKLLVKKDHAFRHFFDFVHFLKKDLSNADLLSCEGVANIASLHDLNLSDLKVGSGVAEKLGLPLAFLPERMLEIKSFALSSEHEKETSQNYLMVRPEDDDYTGRVSYITDLHLLHRFKAAHCKTKEDASLVLRSITKNLAEQASKVNLIGGDTSSDFAVFIKFLDQLSVAWEKGEYFFALGNHELWPFGGSSLDSIVASYKKAIQRRGRGHFHLVHNNLFYFGDCGWAEISEEELSVLPPGELRTKCRTAAILIFGGLGFSGQNSAFNADNGIYLGVLDRREEVRESAKFARLYHKVIDALGDKNLIVFTHMPMRDWGGIDLLPARGVVYVSGHDHRNTFFDDGCRRIYADNQVGYKGQSVAFKKVSIDFNFDWFADYEDGIYEITKGDYEKFYRGIGELLNFQRAFKKLYLVKREQTYMFLMQSDQGEMYVLNGGRIKRAGEHPLTYFYDNLPNYATSVKLYLSKFDAFQKQVSSEVKSFGGTGTIHGSIVDIDFYNHLYLNPLDGSITPYYALSIVDKYVYANIPSLLKYRCPDLYLNYERLLSQGPQKGSVIPYEPEARITKRAYFDDRTEMYRISRILKGLQYTTKHNVVRLWNDRIIADASEANGKQIVSVIIDPELIPESPMTDKTKDNR